MISCAHTRSDVTRRCIRGDASALTTAQADTRVDTRTHISAADNVHAEAVLHADACAQVRSCTHQCTHPCTMHAHRCIPGYTPTRIRIMPSEQACAHAKTQLRVQIQARRYSRRAESFMHRYFRDTRGDDACAYIHAHRRCTQIHAR